VLDDDTVLQLSHRVVKLNDETEYDQRFKALESQINDLRSMLLLNEDKKLHKI
jgi:hypothetical protein